MQPRLLEIACFDIESARIAARAGADRIEFCSNLAEGGLTPDWENTVELREALRCDLNVMIRPRGGDFFYNDEEFEQMKVSIIDFKRVGVQGFVFGILNENNEIDIERNKDLIEFAYPYPCTFHRAFDRTNSIFDSLEKLIDTGFHTILTSGGEKDALSGQHNLQQLVQLAKGRIQILPGGGIRSENIAEIANKSGAHFFHSSAIIDESLLANHDEILRLKATLQTQH